MRPYVLKRLFALAADRSCHYFSLLSNRKSTNMNKAFLCGLAFLFLSIDIFSQCNNVNMAATGSYLRHLAL